VPNPAAILAYFAAAARKPLVISYHSDTVRQPILARIFSPILDRALRRAAAIICTSPQYRDSSPGLVGHQERCHVIPLAIDPEPLERAEPEAIAAIRSRFGPRILLAVGRLVYYKGFEYLIQSMRKVTAHLLIIGRGPLRVALGRQALQYGVADKVTFLGEVDDLAPYYHAADVFILPSIVRTEAFGVVQLEAMACGKPVINTHLDSGVPFVSIDGETGLTVPTADSGALAGAINLLLQEPGLRHQFGVAARQRVLTHFNPKTMVASTLRVFEIAMSQHRLNESARLARPVS
jgi:rhamnosyl/mannosyltransferase